jgi:hypothetical protein
MRGETHVRRLGYHRLLVCILGLDSKDGVLHGTAETDAI